jgi:hypothetical protein
MRDGVAHVDHGQGAAGRLHPFTIELDPLAPGAHRDQDPGVRHLHNALHDITVVHKRLSSRSRSGVYRTPGDAAKSSTSCRMFLACCSAR